MRFILLTSLCVTICYCRYYGGADQSKGYPQQESQQVVQIPLPLSNRKCTGPPVLSGKVSCSAYLIRYTYQNGHCKQFVYGGCGGTSNNFETMEECMRTCMRMGSAKYPSSYYSS